MFDDNSPWDYIAPSMADAHAQWHHVHGKHTICPLDCGIGELEHQDDDEDEESS